MSKGAVPEFAFGSAALKGLPSAVGFRPWHHLTTYINCLQRHVEVLGKTQITDGTATLIVYSGSLTASWKRPGLCFAKSDVSNPNRNRGQDDAKPLERVYQPIQDLDPVRQAKAAAKRWLYAPGRPDH